MIFISATELFRSQKYQGHKKMLLFLDVFNSFFPFLAFCTFPFKWKFLKASQVTSLQLHPFFWRESHFAFTSVHCRCTFLIRWAVMPCYPATQWFQVPTKLALSRPMHLRWSEMARLGFYIFEKCKFIVSGSILQPFSQNKKHLGESGIESCFRWDGASMHLNHEPWITCHKGELSWTSCHGRLSRRAIFSCLLSKLLRTKSLGTTFFLVYNSSKNVRLSGKDCGSGVVVGSPRWWVLIPFGSFGLFPPLRFLSKYFLTSLATLEKLLFR